MRIPTNPQPPLPLYIPVVRCSLVREGHSTASMREIRTADDAAEILTDYLKDLDREHLAIISLDARNRTVHLNTVSIGTQSEALVHPREVFKPAIIASAAAIVLGHNHPSGDPDPSASDVATTKRLQEAGRILGIDVMDHIIIGEGGQWRSLKQLGLMG